MSKKYKDYETNLKKLKDILSALEDDELTLTDSMQKYREALKLLELCRGALDEVDMDIKVLTEEGQLLSLDKRVTDGSEDNDI